MRTRQKRVATDTWRSLGCRTPPLEHWSKRKPTVEPRWAKQQTKNLLDHIGLVKHFNKNLKQMLKNFVNGHQNDWGDDLPFLLLAYRSSIHDSTGCTPNVLFLSRGLSLMAGNPSKSQNYARPVECVELVRNSMAKCLKFVQNSLQKAATRQISIMIQVLNLVLMRLGILSGGVIPIIPAFLPLGTGLVLIRLQNNSSV